MKISMKRQKTQKETKHNNSGAQNYNNCNEKFTKGFKGICEQSDKSSELEDGRMKIIKSEKPKEKKNEEKQAERLRDLWDIIEQTGMDTTH